MPRLFFEVQAADKRTGNEHWVKVEAPNEAAAVELLKFTGLMLGAVRLSDVQADPVRADPINFTPIAIPIGELIDRVGTIEQSNIIQRPHGTIGRGILWVLAWMFVVGVAINVLLLILAWAMGYIAAPHLGR